MDSSDSVDSSVNDKDVIQPVLLLNVSMICESKSTENAELYSEDNVKITTGHSKRKDCDEVEIVDTVDGNFNLQKISSNEHFLNSVIQNPAEVCSSSNEHFLNSVIQNPAEVCSSSTKNMSDLQIINVNENKSFEVKNEMITEETLNKDTYRDLLIVHTDNKPKDCLLTYNLKADSVSDCNVLTSFDSNSNSVQICSSENTVKPVDTMECDIPTESVACDDDVDLTNETDEYYSSYDIEYDFGHTPTQITGSWKEFNSGRRNNFTRGCKWAPDGSCILTCSDDNKLRIFNLPPQLWDSSQWLDIPELEAVLRITEGDLIYDYCWYPLMNSNDASSCCLASTSRKSTVHLWDGYTGELRCSYRSFNNLDELVTPYSLNFDSDGEKLYCGFQNVIRIFDVNRPGRHFEERRIYSRKSGQCGIISCFAFTSANKNIFAVGTYRSSIGLYSESYGELLSSCETETNGITQLQFSPDGNYLYSGGRKDPTILCFDVRNFPKVLFCLRRSHETNQRLSFDISKCGKYVVSGSYNGVITFWDVTKEPKIVNEKDLPVSVPIQFFMAHDDCVNGTSFHPSYPLLCSSSGQRKFPVLLDDDSEDIFSTEPYSEDNSLRLWWIGKLNK